MNNAQSSLKPCILVAPLDWGLGHATRCIPLIHRLLKEGVDVLLAGDGNIAVLLQTEFPELLVLPLPGYGIKYGRSAQGTVMALMRQLPKLLRAIKQETQWLQQTVATYKIDAVISDNRYGLHHPDIFSVFITHQLLIKTPFPGTDTLLQMAVYRYINQFDACWVPDNAGKINLAGSLAHPKRLPQIPVTYLGPISRFTVTTPGLTHYILILLSGPEPQRTLLEERLLSQIKLFQIPIFIVRGLPGAVGLPKVPYHVTIVNHLPTTTMQSAIEGAQLVVSRCGYSTVMDMVALKKKCIFIPTPMQTEQEYLARQLQKQNIALCIPQQKFQLKNAVDLAATFPYQLPDTESGDALQQAVDALLQAL